MSDAAPLSPASEAESASPSASSEILSSLSAPPPTPPPEKVSEQLIEDRSQWLNQILSERTEFLAMRERALPITGGYSFANVTHTQKVTDISQMNRHRILQLIHQHFEAIGMYQTSEILTRESGLVFQAADQKWDRTDLRLLISLAVGHREDPWNLPVDVDHHYVEEPFDEDLLAAPYREDPLRIEEELYDPDLNVVYDSSGKRSLSNIERCSLRRLVVNLVMEENSDEEQKMFFLSINSITSASHFLEHIVTLYDVKIDEARLAASGCTKSQSEIAFQIGKLLLYWKKQRISKRVLELLRQFASRALTEMANAEGPLPGVLRKLKQDLVDRNAVSGLTSPSVPEPMKLLTATVGLLDPDPLEVARQMSLICHEKFARIHPLEFITAMANGSTTVRTATLAEFCEFGDSLTLLVADALLNCPLRQSGFQRIFDIAQNLAQLGNLDALSCVLRFLGNDEVRRIPGSVSPEQLEELWTKAGERGRTEYDAFLAREFAAGDRAAIPNMQVEILHAAKRSAEPDYIDGLINWGKVLPHAQRCALINGFQGRGYTFTVVPQIQKLILKAGDLSESLIQDKLEELARASAK
jgi:hypothetical protein